MSDWTKVNRQCPCLICRKPDWCGYIGPCDDPTVARCMRIESDRPSKGGWIHRLRDSDHHYKPYRRPLKQKTTSKDFGCKTSVMARTSLS